MSDEGQQPESPQDALLGLTSFDIGPAWARGGDEGKKSGEPEKGKEKRHRERERGEGQRGEGRRGEGRRGEGRRGERRRGEDRRGEGRRDERRGGGKGDSGRRFDSRDKDRGDRGKRFQKGGRGRREDDRRGAQRQETPVPAGYTAQVMPVEEGLDGLAKEILAGGRTYSVFDLSKLVLGARERFNVSFRTPSESGLIRCRKDGALWLTREEALRHFWGSDWRTDYYEEVTTEVEPPKGNFQTVARCGISGEWLGPPNYHGYQPALVQLHRERFGRMSLDAYKKKIRMERGEEAVNAWLEKMSKRKRYRPTGGVKEEESVRESAGSTAEGDTARAAGKEATGGTEVSRETPGSSEEGAEAPPEEPGANDEAVPVPAGDEPESAEAEEETRGEEESVEAEPEAAGGEELLLDDAREVERHFLENHFEDAYQVTSRAWVSGNIPGNHLSPGLLTLLRQTVAEERRYPGNLTPMLCRQLSGRHVAVFKWRRKLKAGPSRPHPVPGDIVIADRPKSLLTWIAENSGKKLELLWKHFLPQEVSEQEKLGWYHDLHWLLNQGYVLLMADSSIHLAKKQVGGDQAGSPSKATEGRKGGSPAKVEKAPEPPPRGRGQVARAGGSEGAAGLYVLGGRTLSGLPKCPDLLKGRGLWPLPHRLETEDGEERDDEEQW